MSGSWQAERAAARRLPREDSRAEVGEDVRVSVGHMEFKLYESGTRKLLPWNLNLSDARVQT